MNVVRSDPLNVNRVSEISLDVKGELDDVFDGSERIIAVVIQRPYMRQVYVPSGSDSPARPRLLWSPRFGDHVGRPKELGGRGVSCVARSKSLDVRQRAYRHIRLVHEGEESTNRRSR
jgi:hypothetical protein